MLKISDTVGLEQASQRLKTLGNAQRLCVLCLLLDGEMSVGQINEQLPELSQSVLQRRLHWSYQLSRSNQLLS